MRLAETAATTLVLAVPWAALGVLSGLLRLRLGLRQELLRREEPAGRELPGR